MERRIASLVRQPGSSRAQSQDFLRDIPPAQAWRWSYCQRHPRAGDLPVLVKSSIALYLECIVEASEVGKYKKFMQDAGILMAGKRLLLRARVQSLEYGC